MAATSHSPIQQEISSLALFISLPQIIASPIIAGISHLVRHETVVFDLVEILDFLVISFPLTLSIAILTVIIDKGKFNLFYLLFAVAGAALLSNLLHMLIGKIPFVDLKKTFHEPFNYTEYRNDNTSAIDWVFRIFRIYWKTFGPILFIQSCCIGIYAGYRYHTIEKNKNIRESSKQQDKTN